MARAWVYVRNEVATNALGYVEQECGEGVRESVLRIRVARGGCVRAAEAEDPARSSVVLHLQEKIPIVANIAADSDRVIPLQLCQSRGNRPRPFRAVPRQRIGESHERAVIAGDINRGNTTREPVQVHAADPYLVGRVEPIRF